MKSNTKNGKRAVTHYQVVERSPYLTLLKCTLETGKTHQIRVHTSENLDCPIFNDYTYAQPKNQLSKMGVAYQNLINDYEHPFLHAHLLGFIHPMTQQPVEFTHDPPDIFKKVVGQMRMDQSQKTVSR
jgi:23S rRNA pseudouridine1911/1915/1917 synthase